MTSLAMGFTRITDKKFLFVEMSSIANQQLHQRADPAWQVSMWDVGFSSGKDHDDFPPSAGYRAPPSTLKATRLEGWFPVCLRLLSLCPAQHAMPLQTGSNHVGTVGSQGKWQ